MSDKTAFENNVVAIADQTILRKEKFGGLILVKKKIDMLILNNVGYAILDCCRSPCRVSDIIGELQHRYIADKTAISNDVVAFLTGVLESNLVDIVEAPDA